MSARKPQLELEREIKHFIVNVLGLKDVAPDTIDSTDALFDDGLGLDSLDAIRLVTALQKTYGVSVGSDDGSTRQHLSSVRSIVELIRVGGDLGAGS